MRHTKRKSIAIFAVGAFAALMARTAQALEPDVLFQKVSPSVWEVFTTTAEHFTGLGSAVVVGQGEAVTNCHVLAKAKAVFLRRQNVMYEAKLKHADVGRDLCVLSVANFSAPAVQVMPLAKLKVGQKVYAIGNPIGLEATLSEGLISGLRAEWKDKDEVIQTTAPISPGSSGGGLFDSEGRLIGITTFQSREGQNLNFALPAEWIGQVAARAEAALAKRNEPRGVAGTAAASAEPPLPGYPASGTVWIYQVSEQMFARRTMKVAVRADRVERNVVEEAIYRPDGDNPVIRRSVLTSERRFVSYALGGDIDLVEFAPYLLASTKGDAPAADFVPAGYTARGNQYESAGAAQDWDMVVRRFDWEKLNVPAGAYRAVHYQINGHRNVQNTSGFIAPSARMQAAADQFELDVWYSPEVQRIVKAEHRTWGLSTQLSDYVVELVEYRAPR